MVPYVNCRCGMKVTKSYFIIKNAINMKLLLVGSNLKILPEGWVQDCHCPPTPKPVFLSRTDFPWWNISICLFRFFLRLWKVHPWYPHFTFELEGYTGAISVDYVNELTVTADAGGLVYVPKTFCQDLEILAISYRITMTSFKIK